MKFTRTRSLVAAGTLAVVSIAGVGAATMAGAQTTDPVAGAAQSKGAFFKSLTAEQRQCLQANGVAKPDHKLTKEERQQAVTTLRAAADTCGVTLPARPDRAQMDAVKSQIKSLTPEQKSCLKDNGLTRPQRPMDPAARAAWIAQAKQAAQTCGLAGA